MSDLSASERRLLAALDRIDRSIDLIRAREAEAPAPAAEGASEAARLAAANDELIAANRALMAALDGQGGGEDASRRALEAEIEALKAARAAEIAQLGDVLGALEALTGRQDGGPAGDEEAAGDLPSLPEGGLPRTAEATPMADPEAEER
ncbi:hypothetical protein [Paracoccus sp. S-4012]|uniref:hypothetical protein n=1 Tax=Paracoccus sp. S-4012 TaxID=2665648 RepID=UPI0018A2365C|nr:hypothetical protein [Paracoccus sp. S-4012]